MPGRNIIKDYAPESYYHIYSRGVNKDIVFLDEQDYSTFLSLFKRYLSDKPAMSKARVEYPCYGSRIQLLAYCLMPNHIHLLVYQQDSAAIIDFMRSLMTSYSMYFNRKYDRVGPVFQSRYRARHIDQQSYLEHISRYIHLNPRNWENYNYSSIGYYSGTQHAEWMQPQKILEIFNSNWHEYNTFMHDYQDNKRILDELKWELADQ